MKRTVKTSQHPVFRTALAAAIACPLALSGYAMLDPQLAHASYFNKTLHASETFEHITQSEKPDVLKIGVHKKGYVRLKIAVSNDYKRPLVGANCNLYIDGIYQNYSIISPGQCETTEALAVGPDQTLEMRITPYACSQIGYEITVIDFTPNNLETEPNDSCGKADTLSVDTPRYGLMQNEDRDFYCANANLDGIYDLKLGISRDSVASAHIEPSIQVDGHPVEKLAQFRDRSLKTIKTLPLKKRQKLVVSLYCPWKYESAQSFYQIKLTRKEIPVPELKSLAVKRKALVANWSKTSKHADGYQIRWSTSKSMRNPKKKLVPGTKRTSAKLTGLKAKKRYYVQTRAYYVDYDRETGWHKQYHFFTWSKAKSAKTK